jgi:heparosan-N-sulfate-glucuronate 5-epimerase
VTRTEDKTNAASRDRGGDSPPGSTGILSSEGAFSPEIGSHWDFKSGPRGYYIDFSFKAETPEWPPPWLRGRSREIHVAVVQWGLGAYERYLKGEGEGWMAAALSAADYLLEHQEQTGEHRGGWVQRVPMPHTYELDLPWLSSITQGEGASLFARLHSETGEDRYAEAATEALLSLAIPVAAGGLLAELGGRPFVEEYPTDPPSFVLNGAIFGLWGLRDAGLLLSDENAAESFRSLSEGLAIELGRYDTGWWSRYDLYPHAIENVASPAYHLLHIRQLTVMDRLGAGSRYGELALRFEGYRTQRLNRARAIAAKVAFRISNPRSRRTALRAPWVGRDAALRRARAR